MALSRQSTRLGAIMAILLAGVSAAASGSLAVGSQSGLPLPRFVSLKSDRVNVRAGPTREHQVSWVFTRSGLPVEITAEYENWRRIRDWEGSEGWVYHSLLSGRRTGLVIARSKDELVPLHDAPEGAGRVKAMLQTGVTASLRRCTGTWCYIVGNRFDGWVEQARLWGAYPNETFD
jgi:SH3-like domain-containing protein